MGNQKVGKAVRNSHKTVLLVDLIKSRKAEALTSVFTEYGMVANMLKLTLHRH